MLGGAQPSYLSACIHVLCGLLAQDWCEMGVSAQGEPEDTHKSRGALHLPSCALICSDAQGSSACIHVLCGLLAQDWCEMGVSAQGEPEDAHKSRGALHLPPCALICSDAQGSRLSRVSTQATCGVSYQKAVCLQNQKAKESVELSAFDDPLLAGII